MTNNQTQIYTVYVYPNGSKSWFQNGELHRLDGPAREWAEGVRGEWWQNGNLHREDGPAIIEQVSDSAEGHQNKYWFQNGEHHRLDGPAVELANGGKEWFQNGLLHRTDGPAIEWANGYRYWYQNGKRHRTDGPAAELTDGRKGWWINNEPLTEEEFNTKQNSCNGKIVEIDGKKYTLNLIK